MNTMRIRGLIVVMAAVALLQNYAVAQNDAQPKAAAQPKAQPNPQPTVPPAKPTPAPAAGAQAAPQQPAPVTPAEPAPPTAPNVAAPPAVESEDARPPAPPMPDSGAEAVGTNEDAIYSLVDGIRKKVADDSALEGVSIIDGQVVERSLVPGLDLRLRAEGATLSQRSKLSAAIRAVMGQDEFWKDWIDHHGIVISYAEPPRDSLDLKLVITKSPTELEQVNRLTQLVLDQIELDPRMAGAFVQTAVFALPRDGNARALRFSGRVADPTQIPLLQTHIDNAMAAIDSWRVRRGDVYATLEDVSVGPYEAERSSRFFTIGLDAFWRADYLVAQQAFARAIADNPSSRVLRYWRVLVHIALREEDRARLKLEALLRTDPWGGSGGQVAQALERVQGPLRGRLYALEQEVLLSTLP